MILSQEEKLASFFDDNLLKIKEEMSNLSESKSMLTNLIQLVKINNHISMSGLEGVLGKNHNLNIGR